MKVTSRKTPAFSSVGLPRLFSDLVGVLELVADPSGSVQLLVPDCLSEDGFDALQAKEFCVGLLENPVTHPWSGVLSRCSVRQRTSVAGSLFLFRKCLPVEVDPSELRRSARARLCFSEPVTLPAGYLRHVRKVTRESFPHGWDKGYADLVWSSTPSVSACLEASRGRGGARSLRPDRTHFLRSALSGPASPGSDTVKFQTVQLDGKVRSVTVASATQRVLGPLHRCVYGRLSRLPWLLRGDAKPSKLRRFCSAPGQVFVSGDYESATDFLPIEVAEAILDVMQSSSEQIPAGIWEEARRSLRCKISFEDVSTPLNVVVGQLMGNLLSFPLLCLQNYCAFKWVFPEDVPVAINGDDIVFRSTRQGFNQWSDFVGSVGLRLSRGKTMVRSSVFSINSSFFSASRSRVRTIAVLRTAGLVRPLQDVSGLEGVFRSFCGDLRGPARLLAESLFLRKRRGVICASGRSVRRGLGIPSSISALQSSGLWRRECWYMDSLEVETPLPVTPSKLKWTTVPDGWERVPLPSSRSARRRASAFSDQFVSELLCSAWNCKSSAGELVSDYWREVKGSGHEVSWRSWGRLKPVWDVVCCGGSWGSALRGVFPSDRRIPAESLSACQKWRVSSKRGREFQTPARDTLVWVPARTRWFKEVRFVGGSTL